MLLKLGIKNINIFKGGIFIKRNLKLIKIMLPYFKEYKWILFFDLVCAGFTTLTEMTLPIVMRKVTNAGLGLETLTMSTLLRLCLMLFIMKIVDVSAGYYMVKVGHIMGAKIETKMRYDVFNHLQKLSNAYFSETKVGKIMARITSDLFDITEFAHHCPEEYFIGIIKITFSFIILFRINIFMTLVIFSLIPIMIFFASKYNRGMRKGFKGQKKQIGNLNSDIEDTLLGIKVVKSFANEDLESRKFQKGNLKFLSIKELTYSSMAGFFSIIKSFDGILYILVILMGGYFIINKTINAGDVVAFMLYVSTLLVTINRVVAFTEQFQLGMTGIERFNEIMNAKIEIFDENDAIELENVKGKIEFKNVNFTYNDKETCVLENISFTIKEGEKVAFVGSSGVGKTTLCNLIPRFYDINSGAILIDDKNIKSFTLKSLRNNIGMVQQDVYLFSGSVKENIKYGKPDATDEEIENAAKLAGALEFIQDLPQGFDTYVGERGVKLSGGQKQRISIARVFLKNPPILILDEATSALDNQSERIVQDSLEKLSKGRTTLTIAHRLTTIQSADTIYVLTENGISEKGNHNELMNKRGYYYELYTGYKKMETLNIN